MKTSSTAKAFVVARDGAACRYCGTRVYGDAPEDAPQRLTLDHLWPRSLSGSNGIFNLVVACWRCNQDKKQNKPEGQWAPLPPPKDPPLLVIWGSMDLSDEPIVRTTRPRMTIPFLSRESLKRKGGRLAPTLSEHMDMLNHRL